MSKFFKVKTAARLAIFMAMIVSGVLWTGIMWKMIPDPADALANQRLQLTENIAISASTMIRNNRANDLYDLVRLLLEKNPDLQSVGIRNRDGSLRQQFGKHSENWRPKELMSNQLSVEIQANGRLWATLELCFRQAPARTYWDTYTTYPHNFVAFTSAFVGLLAWVTFAKTFQYLNPTRVVPGRVRSALDSLTEGLVLLDANLNMVHANEAFSQMVAIPSDDLLGSSISSFVWTKSDNQSEMPWELALRTNSRVSAEVIQFHLGEKSAKYHVNANPILDGSGQPRGILVSFDDVTILEEKKQHLADMIETLKASRDEIKKQNSQLKFLASRDPLTKCFNRRSFWEVFDAQWVKVPKHLLNIMMVDIDHFKSINDNFGHSKGDDVLRETGALLLKLVGDLGLVCRFGGEEMAVLLPNLEFEDAVAIADAIHEAFQRCKIGGLDVTASIGVSNRSFGAMDTQHLLDQADQCLYSAKRNGRNQVVRYDRIAHEQPEQKPQESRNDPLWLVSLPYSTVSALHATLAFRDYQAGQHAITLADLCSSVGRELLDARVVYLLESAAMLHELAWTSQWGAGTVNEVLNTPEDYQELLEASCGMITATFGSPCLSWLILGPSGDDPEFLANSESVRLEIKKAHEILRICDQLLHQLEVLELVDKETCREQLTCLIPAPDEISGQISGTLEQLFETHNGLPQRVDSNLATTYAQSTAAVATHIQDLNRALAQRDLGRLKKVLGRMHEDSAGQITPQVSEKLSALTAAAEKRGSEFEDLQKISDELWSLCRTNRPALTTEWDWEDRETTETPQAPLIDNANSGGRS